MALYYFGGIITFEGDPVPDATVTVPGACLDAAEGTQGLLTLVQEAATALVASSTVPTRQPRRPDGKRC